jgi:tripartite-type tricarboxylate transporter receptor subunit TctC
MSRLTRRVVLAAGASALAMPALLRGAQAQGSAWPTKPIRIVVPYPAGGQTDGIGRVFGDFLTRHLGQPVVVENKAGGGGVIGVTEIKRMPPDGYNILCTISSSLIQNRLTVKDLPYDPEKDFIYLSSVSGAGGPVVAAEKTGATNLKEFIAYAKKVDKLNWGSYGVGSTPHVLIETMVKQYGLKVEVIQYRGEAPMWADIAAQTLDGASGSYAAAAPVIQSGRGKLIAVTGDRLSPHPDTPTMKEQGAVGRFYDSRAFTTFAVPAGTPPDIVKKLSEGLVLAGSDPKVKALLANYLLNPPTNFETANAGFKRDTEIMLELLRGLGIKPE